MYRKILVGFENTEQGRDALELGRVLARASGATLLVASVATRDDKGHLPLLRGAERLAAYASAHLHEFDLAIEGRHVKSSSASAGLARLAQDEGVDSIVVGSTHRGPLGRILPGGTGERLLGAAPCAVAVAPRGFATGRGPAAWQPLSEPSEDAGLRVIGVGYDASPEARAALEAATELALRNDAALRVFAVSESPPSRSGWSTEHGVPGKAVDGSSRDALEDAVAELPGEARAQAVHLRGYPASALTEAAGKGIDLLVLGSRGASPLRQTLLGSVSSKVMHGAGCPVLISPPGVSSAQPALALI